MVEARHLPMERGLGKTDRIDNWWKSPLAMGVYLGIAVLYATWRGFMEADFWIFSGFGNSACGAASGVITECQTLAIESNGSHVLSPLFSPLVVPGKEGLGSWVPESLWWMSPAMFILFIPAGFRGTCYYYRKAYYRSFMVSPAACAVSTPFGDYKGESRLFLFQNIHRYFMYIAVAYLFVLAYDVLLATQFHADGGATSYGVSVGTLVLFLNVIMLGGYTLGCHSDRWTTGISKIRGKLFGRISVLNRSHGFWFWTSLIFVFLGDLWVLAVREGYLSDMALFVI